jgi:hypothetical protein
MYNLNPTVTVKSRFTIPVHRLLQTVFTNAGPSITFSPHILYAGTWYDDMTIMLKTIYVYERSSL